MMANKMDKLKCAYCKKNMGNSLSKIRDKKTNMVLNMHSKCQGKCCYNCVHMLARNIEGQCICSNIIQ